MVFEKIQSEAFEQVIYCQDTSVGLKAIIALHSLVLGPALGGCRMWNYVSEEEALTDVLRLSRGMTYKASLAGLHFGGGKAVILGDPRSEKTRILLERFGEFVHRLSGRYITAKDVGIGADDLTNMKHKTPYVLGIEGEVGSSGDPSFATALGVYHGMKACVKAAFHTDSLSGLTFALQGLGSVAIELLDLLKADGVQLIGCDIDPARIQIAQEKVPTIKIVSPDEILSVRCDVLSPSALGAVLHRGSIPHIQAKIVAGAANNQLATFEDGYDLSKRGICYAPDYAINAGGLINIAYEDPVKKVYNRQGALEHVTGIERTIERILERSRADHLPTHIVADRMAEERIHAGEKRGRWA